MSMSQLSFWGSVGIAGIGAVVAILAGIFKDDRLDGKPLLFGKWYKFAAAIGAMLFLGGIAWALIATHAF